MWAEFVIGGALVALIGAVIRHWVRRRARRREQLWLESLSALAAGDYADAEALAARLQERAEVAPAHGEPAFILGHIVHRIKALESMEREEHRARRQLEDVLASLQDAVLVVDEEARLAYLNPVAMHFFEAKVADVLGRQVLEALPSLELESAVRLALRDGRDSAHEMSFYSPRPREVFLRVTPLRRSTGQTVGAVAILQDLTEVRRLERVRHDFVANASHELRTPVANIRVAAETILISPEDPMLVSRFLPQILTEAERLSWLVSDLLDLARVESPEHIMATPVDLVAVANEAVQRLANKAAQHQIQVRRDFTDECGGSAFVLGNAAALEQVVFNLLDNALSYTPPGGSVTLRLVPEEARDGIAGIVSLSVSDTGTGIPEADLSRIFERFYRVDKARSRARGGTGLGLAIVKHIVENYKGHIEVTSELGRGTTFNVALPAASPRPTPSFLQTTL
jgi:two-component system, OmpR family, phosphate regulon sensor histidine kinase PhoR